MASLCSSNPIATAEDPASPKPVNTQQQPQVTAAIVRLILGGMIISFSSVFVKLAHISPGVSAFYRVAFGGSVLFIWVIFKRPKLFHGLLNLMPAMLAALFFTIDLYAWHYSIQYIGPGLATILTNFQVFILAAVGVIFFSERLTFKMAISAPLAILGLMLALGIEWHLLPQTHRLGLGWGLAAALAYAGFTLTLRKIQGMPEAAPAWVNLFCVTIISAGMLGLLGAVQGRSFAIVDLQTLAALLGLGLLSQVVGWVVITGALPRIKPSVVGLALLLQPTLAFIWDMLFFNRQASLMNLVGVALTICGIYLGSAPRSRRRRQASNPFSPF